MSSSYTEQTHGVDENTQRFFLLTKRKSNSIDVRDQVQEIIVIIIMIINNDNFNLYSTFQNTQGRLTKQK